MPAADAAELEVGGEVDVRGQAATPCPGRSERSPAELPPIEIADIKAARQEALLGKAE